MYNKHLDVFIKTAELGSFSKAAKESYISSTALIQQISLLEQDIGIKLFYRSHSGVKLTEAGESLYEDAKNIINISKNAINKAKKISKEYSNLVKIGTSFLTKPKYIGNLLLKMKKINFQFEIKFIPQQLPSSDNFIPLKELGYSYEIFEGIYVSEFYREKCNFLKIKEFPILPAIPKNNKLFKKKRIYFEDLKNKKVVLIKANISKNFDSLRNKIEKYKNIEIIDVPFYDMETFLNCELNNYILFIPSIWEDINPNLVVHEFEEKYTIPYGLIFKDNLSEIANKFIQEVSLVLNNN